jgi:hypothetical protein
MGVRGATLVVVEDWLTVADVGAEGTMDVGEAVDVGVSGAEQAPAPTRTPSITTAKKTPALGDAHFMCVDLHLAAPIADSLIGPASRLAPSRTPGGRIML